ncbi:MAG: DUF4058 family protein [Caldilineaceae bacterium]|nr:DUF4058 family protein [Caldilineaceae bacterium]
MPYPFPGMNPYLERPSLWPDVHLELILAIRLALTQSVSPRYYIAVEERTYIAAIDPQTLVGRPDVAVIGAPRAATPLPVTATIGSPVQVLVPISDEVRERYLEIRESGTHRVITVIEILSPSNKAPGQGRTLYEAKRLTVLDSATHLVEIDLLRIGEPLAAHPMPQTDYRILISRSWQRPRSFLYGFNLANPIPDVPIPLQRGEDEPILALNPLLKQIYTDVRYDLRIDYTSSPPQPPIDKETSAWMEQLLRQLE